MSSQRTYRGNSHEHRVPRGEDTSLALHPPCLLSAQPRSLHLGSPHHWSVLSCRLLSCCRAHAEPRLLSSPALSSLPANFLLALGTVQTPLPGELSQSSLHTTVSPCPRPSQLTRRHSPLPSSSQGPSLCLVGAAGLRAEVKGAEGRMDMYSAPLPQP